MQISEMTIKSKDIKPLVTLHVRVKVARMIGVRLWLLPKLLRFAAWVGGVGIEINTGENDENRSGSGDGSVALAEGAAAGSDLRRSGE